MVEKTLILKQISGMLCLLNSYSKFTRPRRQRRLTVFPRADKLNSRDFYILERWAKGALHGQNDATARSCRMDRQFENIQWKKGD